MIGIIGPEDSVRLALSVAAEEGRADEVTTRVYTRPEQAVELARQIDDVCQVLLFTGRIPYAFVRHAGQLNAAVDFMPHSGIDLYRILARLLTVYKGELPSVSVDTVEASIVRETFRDIDMEPPTRILPITDESGELIFSGLSEITEYHREQYASGAVQACLTCLGAVHRELVAAGVPAFRIEHTRASVRDALHRAWQAAEVRQSRGTQIAVMLVQLVKASGWQRDPYEAERNRLRVHEALLEHAERLRGRLSTVDNDTFLVTTTRGAVDSAVARHKAGHASLLTPRGLDAPHVVGFGIGTTVATAEDNARKALTLSQQSGGHTHVVFPDGEVYSTGTTSVPSRLRETAPSVLRISEQLGLGPLSTRRLLDALHRLDPSELTARQLADAYGVETRSARRLLNSLKVAGYAEEVGLHVSTGAGRPQTVYRVDLRRLVDELSGDPV